MENYKTVMTSFQIEIIVVTKMQMSSFSICSHYNYKKDIILCSIHAKSITNLAIFSVGDVN